MEDRFKLKRFVDAQNDVYEQVRLELIRGRKTGHWMWFIFPQFQGLGQSQMSVRYAISSILEAKAYFLHPLLGSRLIECCNLLLDSSQASIEEIMGYPDDLKLKSSMTLFNQSTGENHPFLAVLGKYFRSEQDGATLKLIAS